MMIRLSNGNGKHIGKYPYFLITAVVLITFCTPAGLSVENPSVRNPAGFGTVPQSTLRSGLVRNYSPSYNSGNLIVTGNVSRGGHFRGDVPYQSTAAFGASLGTSTLSSFLRDSANSENVGSYSGYMIQPYYSPAETVTTMSPDSLKILRPADTRIDGRSTVSGSSGITEVTDLASLQSRITAGRTQSVDTADSMGLLSNTRTPSLTEPQSMLLSQYRTEKLLPGADLVRQPDEQETDARQQQQSQQDNSSKGNNFWDPQQYENYLKNALDESRRLSGDSSRQEDSLGLKQQNRIDGTVQTTDFGPFGQNESLLAQQNIGGQTERDLTNQMPGAFENFPSPAGGTQQESSVLQPDRNLSEYGVQEMAGGYDTLLPESDDFFNVQSSIPPNRSTEIQDNSDTYDVDRRNTLEQIQQRLDTLIKSIERASVRLNEQKARNDDLIPGLKEKRLLSPQAAVDRRSSERIDGSVTTNYNPPALTSSNDPDTMNLSTAGNDNILPSGKTGTENNQDSISESGQIQQDSDSDVSARARNIMGKYTSLDSFSEAKFQEYFRTGAENLSAGRYYRAASAFTLASMYKPEDPLSLAGKGHALFAAGDYVSSALFISRALEFDPGYIRIKVDLSAVLGGVDKMETRISDVEEWLSRSGSEQLSFLLAYVCYRTGELEKAKKAIDIAFEKMPQSIAVLAVKTAVDQDLSIQR